MDTEVNGLTAMPTGLPSSRLVQSATTPEENTRRPA
jgi:hypothetical protein